MTSVPAWLLLILVALSTFRLTRLLTVDFLLDPFRGWVAHRFGDESKVTYLSECPWCLSIWFAPFPTVAAIWWPTNRVLLAIMVALAASAVTGLISTRWDD